MKALSRKCTAFLLSLTLLLTLAPTALASEALGDDLDLRSTTLNRGAELGEGTFWSNTFSDLRQENYVVYTPNTSVTPIVTYGDYTTATSTVSAAAKRLEEQGLRVVAGINGDYYDTLNGAPLGTVMTDGVLRVASASNYAVGFRADGTAILGAPALAMQVESANTSFSIAAVNQVRYSYGGIYLYTYDFNARRSTGTNAAGYDVVCSAVDGRLSIGESLTLTVDEILPEATDTAVSEGKYVLTGYSIGASLTQVAQRMIELGCVTALSLDGGGSTTLCVTLPEDGNAGVYNTPSEGSLRAVTNHIFLVASNEPSGTLDHIALRTESGRVLAGAQVLLRASAIDTNYIPMDKEVSIASDRGSVRTDELGNTVLTAPKTAGTVTVGAKVGGKYTTAELRVVETPDEIRLGKSGTLTELRVSPGASRERWF